MTVSEIGLVVGAMVLSMLLVHFRRKRLAGSGRWRRVDRAGVSLAAMTEMVAELTPTLRQTAMVTAPQSSVERGHVWASPCGKRVYIN